MPASSVPLELQELGLSLLFSNAGVEEPSTTSYSWLLFDLTRTPLEKVTLGRRPTTATFSFCWEAKYVRPIEHGADSRHIPLTWMHYSHQSDPVHCRIFFIKLSLLLLVSRALEIADRRVASILHLIRTRHFHLGCAHSTSMHIAHV